MEAILEFAKNATPMIIIALALVIILLLVLGNDGIAKIFNKQKLNTFKIEGGKASLESIREQLKVIAGNHLHELPEMRSDIASIKLSVEGITKEQIAQGNRLTSVETAIKFITKI